MDIKHKERIFVGATSAALLFSLSWGSSVKAGEEVTASNKDEIVRALGEKEKVQTHVGKIEAGLAKKIEKMSAGKKIRVAIWLTNPDEMPALPGRPEGASTEEQVEDVQGSRQGQLKDAIAAHAKGVSEAIKSKKGKVNLVARLAPVVYAEVKVSDLQEIAARPEVDTVYEERLTGGREADVATRTHKVELDWAKNVVGLQARACIVEDDGVASNNPHIAFGEYYNPGTPNVDQHATTVAGIIQGEGNPDPFTGRDLRGHAWGAQPILSGNSLGYSEASLIAATEWCVLDNQPTANVVNHSYFTDTSRNFTALDRYFDYVVRYAWVMQVKSAGNRGLSDANVTSPGKGWNTLTVGSVDDKDTSVSAGDVMSAYSSYVDPFVPSSSSTLQKPEVVAVGCHDYGAGINLRSNTHVDPWSGDVGCGTSFSAPAVTGTALLLMQKDPTLKVWPEATKAIILATAIQNIEGNKATSDKDGAGRMRSDLAVLHTVSNPQRYKYAGIDIATYGTRDELSFARAAGKRLRCALVWDSEASGGVPPTNDALLTDLDLRIVRQSDGAVVSSSASIYNAFEVVDVNVPTADTYLVRVNVYSSSEVSNYMGLACYAP